MTLLRSYRKCQRALIVLSSAILLSACATPEKVDYSKPVTLPSDLAKQCNTDNFKYRSKVVYLNSQQSQRAPHLYLLTNVSKIDLLINHPIAQPAASAGWASELKPGHSSVILIGKPNFPLSCESYLTGQQEFLPCNKVLKVCQLNATPDSKTAVGDYWVVENVKPDQVIPKVESRQISFKQ